MIHWHKPLVTVETPLLAKGIVLDDGKNRCVVCVVDWSPGYICTKKAFSEGGYEPGTSNVAPESEKRLKEAIRRVLAGE